MDSNHRLSPTCKPLYRLSYIGMLPVLFPGSQPNARFAVLVSVSVPNLLRGCSKNKGFLDAAYYGPEAQWQGREADLNGLLLGKEGGRCSP